MKARKLTATLAVASLMLTLAGCSHEAETPGSLVNDAQSPTATQAPTDTTVEEPSGEATEPAPLIADENVDAEKANSKQRLAECMNILASEPNRAKEVMYSCFFSEPTHVGRIAILSYPAGGIKLSDPINASESDDRLWSIDVLSENDEVAGTITYWYAPVGNNQSIKVKNVNVTPVADTFTGGEERNNEANKALY